MLLKFARSNIGSWSISWMFEHMSSVLPVDRLYETPLLLAFTHPKPVYPIHILIVPKMFIRDLMDLEIQPDPYRSELMKQLLVCVKELVARQNLESAGYRLIINGGIYQDVGILHFHLVSGITLPGK